MTENCSNSYTRISIVVKVGIGALGFVILIMSRYAFFLFLMAMLPSITSIIIDRSSNKYGLTTLCSFNLIGVLPFMFDIFKSSDSNALAGRLFKDANTWLTIYGSTAMGWFLIWAIPLLSAKMFLYKSDFNIKNIDKKQLVLKEDWGEEVALKAKEDLVV